MLQLMIRPLLVNATCHWLYMTEVELGDCKIKLLCMHVLAQCQQSMSILIERISGARVLCPLEELKSAFRESHQLWPITRYLSNPLGKTILCSSRKHPATWFCASNDCITRVFTTVLKFLFFLTGPLKWEKVPSASEKNSQSKAWYTVKKDSVHIKTKSFSFWSIFLCGGGGPKRKRATVFASKPSEEFDTICFRFYIYNDNEDSKTV